jgi:1-acyl-sn-glycerol-3-phosphate acyltransferase
MLYRFTRFVLKHYFHLLYHNKVDGLENFPQGAAIVAPNHTSFFDPPLIAASLPGDIHYLARETLFDNRIFGWIIKTLHAHPVSMEANNLETFKTVLKLLKEGDKVVIFPEGERSVHGDLLPLQLGVAYLAERAQVPIIPLKLKGNHALWPINKAWPKFSGRTSCTVCPPIYPEAFAHIPKKERAAAITEALTQALN